MKNILVKCKNCGGVLTYSPEHKKLSCVNCGCLFDIDEVVSKKRFHNFVDYVPRVYDSSVNVYECKSCGSIQTMVEGQEICRCSTCGSIELKQKTSVAIEPDVFKPFEISKKVAAQKFKDWLKSRKFAPNALKQFARDAKLTGVYVPMWHFICDFTAHYSGYIEEEDYDSNGQRHVSRRSVSGVVRKHDLRRNVAASSALSEVFCVEPFDEERGVEYNPSYVYGFSMLKNDIDEKQAYKILRRIIRSDAEFYASSQEFNIRGLTIDNLDIFNVGIEFCYVPVWVNYYKFQDKTYRCLINGVTGEVSGKYPKSFWKIFGLVAGIIGTILLLALIF